MHQQSPFVEPAPVTWSSWPDSTHCIPEASSSPNEMQCVQGGQCCNRFCKRSMSAILMQLEARQVRASSCDFSDPVSKDLLHCINIVRIVTHQRNRHRFVPRASVCRSAYCNSDCLAFDRKAGLRCSPFHGDDPTQLLFY